MEVASLDKTDASNNASPPDGFPEQMQAAAVNNAARALLGALARYHGAVSGLLDSTFSSNEYTIQPGMTYTVPKAGHWYTFKAAESNTGACTLVVDTQSAKDLKAYGNRTLAAGEIVENNYYTVVYTGSRYELIHSLDVRLLYALMKTMLTAGSRATVTPDDTDRTIEIQANAQSTDLSSKLDTDLDNIGTVSSSDATDFREAIDALGWSSSGTSVKTVRVMTETAYNALSTKDSNTLYLLT